MPSSHLPSDAASTTCDLLVVGSGAGALSAAVTAAHLGLKVIVVEKDPQYGGTTAWSGGWMWIPRNPLALAAGIAEPLEKPLSYLRHELGAQFDEARALAFLTQAPNMVRFFQQHTALQFVDGNSIPDFHGRSPDAATGGRSVCAAPFDGRALGEHIAQLKPPLYETTLWGMGIASGADLRHFFNSLRSWTSFVHVTARVLRHVRDLLWHGRGMQLVNGNALVAALAKSALDAGVDLRVNSPAVCLLTQGQGGAQGDAVRVCGAVVRTPQGEQQVHARRGVVLATGGFPHDPARKRALLPHDPQGDAHFSAASRGNTGDGLRLGESVGAVVANDLRQAAALAPVSLVPQPDGGVTHFPHLMERAKPGLIAVTRLGQRFANEADSYHDFMQGLMQALPAGEPVQAWLVCDHRFIRRWGLGAVKPAPMPLAKWLANGYLQRGATLPELAERCGIQADTLQATVARYNVMAHTGSDAEFGKGETPYNRIQGDATHPGPNPCMAALQHGPFYAVRVVAGSLGTFAGLRCNEHAQVLNAQGQAIGGLYAGGNDMNSIMGGHYPSGGITLGPAMTFGYIAAHHAAAQPLHHTFFKRTSMYYELATLTLPFGTAVQAAKNVETFAAQGQGELLGCWFTDIGTLNQMVVLRGFHDLASLHAERERTQRNASPFGCGDIFQSLEQHSYQGFPWMKPVRPSAESGIHGLVYEIRTYGIKPGGVQPTLDLWEQAVPARDKLSPCVVAMVALDGPLRFTNIWAYPSLDARAKARADSVAQGIWPPKGGPAWLTTAMTSTIAMPTAVSPLK
ncbi:FAD-dependent oxidoreductase [Limnohabitans sp. JirII-31]|uniref:FAD-dependent oxidoreductase n=1 Tax=Limnohabitans sp. JirII-31 TaxID=1977908 RepID=UPI000C1EF1D2|nr:FAD-dependent oxidoreductase [Limnohabitans sp. JirII-31]PIT79795.1 FAD-binding dehydrogenase [Limnohabitans sp. JirII-31]